ncbi:MAG: hypothetical protein B7Z75_07260 [Acidocella sp. 20-57-95]|nr:MAG: hypothetical protein B7Z75_07260 [Acidocella sp. 20-57-95]OYV62639.1 MAG: hypothetical protein B7Z71_00385 [Acidocella sp. 21-58-7]HQT63527.1 rhodanese-like domain-containing protein [Acidocella sp.]HQU03301.1 rhodanese-like domain-containing protein [Acidocella sp.]
MSLPWAEGQSEISIADYVRIKAASPDLVLLDVREPYELAMAAVTGALHIPMQTIPARIAEIPREVPVAVICHHGARSMAVVNYLRKAGFENTINLAGGIHAYANEADGSIPLY